MGPHYEGLSLNRGRLENIFAKITNPRLQFLFKYVLEWYDVAEKDISMPQQAKDQFLARIFMYVAICFLTEERLDDKDLNEIFSDSIFPPGTTEDSEYKSGLEKLDGSFTKMLQDWRKPSAGSHWAEHVIEGNSMPNVKSQLMYKLNKGDEPVSTALSMDLWNDIFEELISSDYFFSRIKSISAKDEIKFQIPLKKGEYLKGEVRYLDDDGNLQIFEIDFTEIQMNFRYNAAGQIIAFTAFPSLTPSAAIYKVIKEHKKSLNSYSSATA